MSKQLKKQLKSLRDRLTRRRPRGDDNLFDKVYWKLRPKLRACTHILRSTWVGPTPTLMGLPVEVRLIIHEYTLQDIINNAQANSLKPLTPFHGGLALCHVNRTLRAECQDIFVPLMMESMRLRQEHNYTVKLRYVRGTPEEREAGLWASVFETVDTERLLDLCLNLAMVRGRTLRKKWSALMEKEGEILDKIEALGDYTEV